MNEQMWIFHSYLKMLLMLTHFFISILIKWVFTFLDTKIITGEWKWNPPKLFSFKLSGWITLENHPHLTWMMCEWEVGFRVGAELV